MPYLFLALSAVLTILTSQAFVVVSVSQALAWPFLYPDAFLVSWSVVFAISLFCSLLLSTRWALGLVQGGFILVGIVSFLKQRSLGSPLYPWDFYVLNEMLWALPGILKSSWWICLMLAGGIMLLIGLMRLLPVPQISKTQSRRRRFAIGAICLGYSTLIILANNPVHTELFGKHFNFKLASPQASYSENGLFVSIIIMKEKGEVFPPLEYTQEKANALYREYSGGSQATASEVRPDIIAIMSESLFDPLQLSDIHWNQDPLKFTRSLNPHRKFSSSVIPTFGYRTGNSEFEFLTGNAVFFFASGTVPYLSLIQKDQPSIVTSLKEAGYRTLAIHPGIRELYNRDHVYPLLGFDRYISVDGFAQATKFGNQVSDESILPLLKESLESKGPEPSFNFVVTIQNHYPYLENPFELKDPMFDTKGLSQNEQIVLNYYSKLLQATDRFHEDLVNYLKTRKRPTVLIIFGDHLPSLLPGFDIYTKGILHSANQADWTPAEWQKMYSTPLVIWSNFAMPDEPGPLEISLLGPRLLRQLGLPLSPYHRFVADLSDHTRLLQTTLAPKQEEGNRELLQKYKVFQYGTFTHLLPASDFDKTPSSAQKTPLSGVK